MLSRGGQAVREGARYQLVYMGKEMFDPQTNQSFGRVESDCCEVVIDRVTPTMSQGHLEKMQLTLDGLQPGDLQLRGLVGKVAVVADKSDKAASEGKAGEGGKSVGAQGHPAAAKPIVDDKWWFHQSFEVP